MAPHPADDRTRSELRAGGITGITQRRYPGALSKRCRLQVSCEAGQEHGVQAPRCAVLERETACTQAHSSRMPSASPTEAAMLRGVGSLRQRGCNTGRSMLHVQHRRRQAPDSDGRGSAANFSMDLGFSIGTDCHCVTRRSKGLRGSLCFFFDKGPRPTRCRGLPVQTRHEFLLIGGQSEEESTSRVQRTSSRRAHRDFGCCWTGSGGSGDSRGCTTGSGVAGRQ